MCMWLGKRLLNFVEVSVREDPVWSLPLAVSAIYKRHEVNSCNTSWLLKQITTVGSHLFGTRGYSNVWITEVWQKAPNIMLTHVTETVHWLPTDMPGNFVQDWIKVFTWFKFLSYAPVVYHSPSRAASFQSWSIFWQWLIRRGETNLTHQQN